METFEQWTGEEYGNERLLRTSDLCSECVHVLACLDKFEGQEVPCWCYIFEEAKEG